MPQNPVDDWQDVEDDWEDVAPVAPPVAPAKKGMLQKWDEQWINQPLSRKVTMNGEQLFDPAAAANYYDPRTGTGDDQWKIPSWVPMVGGGSLRSLGAGMLEGAGSVVEGLTTPLNLATAGTASTAVRAAKTAPQLANVAHRATQALSAPMIASGAARAGEGARTGEYGNIGFGIAEMAGGAAGLRMPKPGAAGKKAQADMPGELPVHGPHAMDADVNLAVDELMQVRKAQQQAKAAAQPVAPIVPEAPGIVPNEGVTPAPPVIDPQAQAVRDQTAKPRVRANLDNTFTDQSTGQAFDPATLQGLKPSRPPLEFVDPRTGEIKSIDEAKPGDVPLTQESASAAAENYAPNPSMPGAADRVAGLKGWMDQFAKSESGEFDPEALKGGWAAFNSFIDDATGRKKSGNLPLTQRGNIHRMESAGKPFDPSTLQGLRTTEVDASGRNVAPLQDPIGVRPPGPWDQNTGARGPIPEPQVPPRAGSLSPELAAIRNQTVRAGKPSMQAAFDSNSLRGLERVTPDKAPLDVNELPVKSKGVLDKVNDFFKSESGEFDLDFMANRRAARETRADGTPDPSEHKAAPDEVEARRERYHSTTVSQENRTFIDRLPDDDLRDFIRRQSANPNYDTETGRALLDHARDTIEMRASGDLVFEPHPSQSPYRDLPPQERVQRAYENTRRQEPVNEPYDGPPAFTDDPDVLSSRAAALDDDNRAFAENQRRNPTWGSRPDGEASNSYPEGGYRSTILDNLHQRYIDRGGDPNAANYALMHMQERADSIPSHGNFGELADEYIRGESGSDVKGKGKSLAELESTKRTPALERLGKLMGDKAAGELASGAKKIEFNEKPHRIYGRSEKKLPQHTIKRWSEWGDDTIADVDYDRTKPGMHIKEPPTHFPKKLEIEFRDDNGLPIGVLSTDMAGTGISTLAVSSKIGLRRGKVAFAMLKEAFGRGITEPSGITSDLTKNLIDRVKRIVENTSGEFDADVVINAINKLIDNISNSKVGKAVGKFLKDETGSGDIGPAKPKHGKVRQRLNELYDKDQNHTLTAEDLVEARRLTKHLNDPLAKYNDAENVFPEDVDSYRRAKNEEAAQLRKDGYDVDMDGNVTRKSPQETAAVAELEKLVGGKKAFAKLQLDNILDKIKEFMKSESGEGDIGPRKLPRELGGAKARFNVGADTYFPNFADDLDRALYIIAQSRKSKGDAGYLKFVMEETGLSEVAARNLGQKVKGVIKQAVAGKEPGKIDIPSVARAKMKEPPPARPMQSAQEYMSGKSKVDTGPLKPENVKPAPDPAVAASLAERLKKATDDAGTPNALAPEDISKLMDEAADVLNKLPEGPEKAGIIRQTLAANKALLTSWDFSAPGRQGKAFILNKSWWTSLDDMVKAWGSKGAADNINQSIIDHPSGYFEKPVSSAGKKGKSFAEKMGLDLASTEEAFSGVIDRAAHKIPGVARSGRAHTAFLNKLRSDQFVSMMDDAKKAGMNPETDVKLAKAYAKFINDATGRGSVNIGRWKLERNLGALNDVFFAPKNMSGQIRTWNAVLNPYKYWQADPVLRKQALKSLFAVAGLGLAVGEAARLGGAEVSNDPVSADFRKIKLGDTRIDMFGGYQQFPVAAMKFILGKATPTTGKNAGETQDLTQGRMGQSRFSVAERFFLNRLSPAGSLIYAWMSGREFDGKPFEIKRALFERTAPIAMKDILELATEDPALAATLGPATLTGLVGTQTYSGR